MAPTLTLQKIHVRELTPFEMGLGNFCFESDRRFFIEVGDRQIQLFFDPDICMILEDGLPEQIDKLSQGKEIYIAFFISHEVRDLFLSFPQMRESIRGCTFRGVRNAVSLLQRAIESLLN